MLLCHRQLYSSLLCVPALRKTPANVFSHQIGSGCQTKVPYHQSPLEWATEFLLELLTGIWVKGYLQKLKCLKDSCHQKSHPSMGDNSQNLETWISGPSLQASQWVGECPFQETTSLFSSPQLILSPLPPGNLAGLSHSESLSSPYCLYVLREGGTQWITQLQGLPRATELFPPSSYWACLYDGKSHLHLEHSAAIPPFHPIFYQVSLQNGRF